LAFAHGVDAVLFVSNTRAVLRTQAFEAGPLMTAPWGKDCLQHRDAAVGMIGALVRNTISPSGALACNILRRSSGP